jgi:hypothetical protein
VLDIAVSGATGVLVIAVSDATGVLNIAVSAATGVLDMAVSDAAGVLDMAVSEATGVLSIAVSSATGVVDIAVSDATSVAWAGAAGPLTAQFNTNGLSIFPELNLPNGRLFELAILRLLRLHQEAALQSYGVLTHSQVTAIRKDRLPIGLATRL